MTPRRTTTRCAGKWRGISITHADGRTEQLDLLHDHERREPARRAPTK